MEKTRKKERPLRQSYKHLVCGVVTLMEWEEADAMQADPRALEEVFCAGCLRPFLCGEAGEFVWWDGTKVGGVDGYSPLIREWRDILRERKVKG